jgi:hypothetical protein
MDYDDEGLLNALIKSNKKKALNHSLIKIQKEDESTQIQRTYSQILDIYQEIDDDMTNKYNSEIHSYWIFIRAYDKLYSSESSSNSMYSIALELITSLDSHNIKEQLYCCNQIYDTVLKIIEKLFSEKSFNLRGFIRQRNNDFVCLLAIFILLKLFLPSMYVQTFMLRAELSKLIETKSDQKIPCQKAWKEIKFLSILFLEDRLPYIEKMVVSNKVKIINIDNNITKKHINDFLKKINKLDGLTTENMNSPQRKMKR